MLTRKRAEHLLEQITTRKILVVGDLMIDRYVCGRVDRISPEAPVPIVHVLNEYERPGGAANVAVNVNTMGAKASVCGISGQDDGGMRLTTLLNACHIDTAGIVRSQQVCTTVKTRVVADRQQIARVDRESIGEDISQTTARLIHQLPELISKTDGIIIEDYGKGVISQSLVDTIIASAESFGIPVGYDPKANHRLVVKPLTLATPNYREACLLAGISEEPLTGNVAECKSLHEAADILSTLWQVKTLMITLGPHGMFLHERSGNWSLIPTRAREVYDVSGAGDTVIAVALTALSAGASPSEAGELANHAAGIVVAKTGTACCTRDELQQALQETLDE